MKAPIKINLTRRVDTQIKNRKESNIISTVNNQASKTNKKEVNKDYSKQPDERQELVHIF